MVKLINVCKFSLYIAPSDLVLRCCVRLRSDFSGRSTDEQASPAGASGWMQQLLTKVLANISIEASLKSHPYVTLDPCARLRVKSACTCCTLPLISVS